MYQQAVDLLRLEITAATQAASDAAAEATRINNQATIDRSSAATALATAIQDKIDASTARGDILRQLNAATTLITNLQNQVSRTPTPTTPTVFSLTPGQISPTLILDYASKDHKAIYDKAILPFSITFDGAISNVRIFQDNLCQRSKDFTWANITSIPDSKGTDRDIFLKYGCVTIADITTHAGTWVKNDGRASQNNQMLVKLITESISPKVRKRIGNNEDAFTVEGVRIGTLMFKLIMNKTIIDTRATAAAFRRDLSNLDIFMATCNSNIELFNEHVNTAVEGLKARDERVDDLMTHLFKGYKIANDIKFVAYIELQETQYMQGSDLSTDLLMTQALNDYNTKIISNTWGAPSDEQRQIVALSAELKTIKDNNIELSRSMLDKLKRTKDRRSQQQDEPWRTLRGTGPDSMVKDGTTMHWCTYHKRWNLHKTSDCKAKNRSNGRQRSPSTPAPSPSTTTPVSYAATFAATMASINEETHDIEE